MITFLVAVLRVECHFNILKLGFNVDLRRHTNECEGSTNIGARVGGLLTHMELKLQISFEDLKIFLSKFRTNFNFIVCWSNPKKKKKTILVYIDHFFVGELGRVPICHHGLPLAPKLVGNKETEGTPGSRA